MRAFAIDQRGFGEPDHPVAVYTIPELAADTVAFLDALDIERAALVGHSYGSLVAIAHPNRVERLVLIGTRFAERSPVVQEARAAVRDLPDPISIEFVRSFQAGTAYRPLPPEFFDRRFSTSRSAFLYYGACVCSNALLH